MQTVNPRNSVFNRTMIVSKRNRRPGLPEIQATNHESSQPEEGMAVDERLTNSAEALPKNHHRRDTVTYNSPHQTLPEPMIDSITEAVLSSTDTFSTICQNQLPSLLPDVEKIFDGIDQMNGLSDHQKLTDSKKKILALISNKDKEWSAFAQKQEKDKHLKSQICDLKLSVANRTSSKAEAFCKICEEHEIDYERILRRESNALHRLRAVALNEMGQQPKTPDGNAELLRLSRERDTLSDEIRSLENNYSNLFKLYEKMRENCIQLKTSEDTLKNEVSNQNKKYNSLYSLYNELLNDAQEQLNKADSEMIRIEKDNEDKTLGIRLALKRAQIQIKSMEVALESKSRENEELNKICNELLSNRDSVMLTSNITDSEIENRAR